LRLGQRTGRRSYASAGDTVKKTSDLPWAATAALLTTVGTYIALQPRDPVGDHGHGDHHGEHEEKEEGESEEKSEDADEEPKDEGKSDDEGGKDEAGGEGGEDKEESKDDSEKAEAKDDSKDDKDESESKSDSGEDSKESGSGSKDDLGELHVGKTKKGGGPKKSESDDGKGSNKKRIDSPAGKKIGEGASSGEDTDRQGDIQKGFSNTDTKHSEDPNQDPGASSKGEGTADTAKIKGTVKVDRKQV